MGVGPRREMSIEMHELCSIQMQSLTGTSVVWLMTVSLTSH